MHHVLNRRNLLVMFPMTVSCDKLQMRNSDPRCVAGLENTLQAQHQNCMADN